MADTPEMPTPHAGGKSGGGGLFAELKKVPIWAWGAVAVVAFLFLKGGLGGSSSGLGGLLGGSSGSSSTDAATRANLDSGGTGDTSGGLDTTGGGGGDTGSSDVSGGASGIGPLPPQPAPGNGTTGGPSSKPPVPAAGTGASAGGSSTTGLKPNPPQPSGGGSGLKPNPPQPSGRTHVVVSGETLNEIAQHYGIAEENLYHTNENVIEATAMQRTGHGSYDGNLIYPGERLVIP